MKMNPAMIQTMQCVCQVPRNLKSYKATKMLDLKMYSTQIHYFCILEKKLKEGKQYLLLRFFIPYNSNAESNDLFDA